MSLAAPFAPVFPGQCWDMSVRIGIRNSASCRHLFVNLTITTLALWFLIHGMLSIFYAQLKGGIQDVVALKRSKLRSVALLKLCGVRLVFYSIMAYSSFYAFFIPFMYINDCSTALLYV